MIKFLEPPGVLARPLGAALPQPLARIRPLRHAAANGACVALQEILLQLHLEQQAVCGCLGLEISREISREARSRRFAIPNFKVFLTP